VRECEDRVCREALQVKTRYETGVRELKDRHEEFLKSVSRTADDFVLTD
jgi:hypothetical protein